MPVWVSPPRPAAALPRAHRLDRAGGRVVEIRPCSASELIDSNVKRVEYQAVAEMALEEMCQLLNSGATKRGFCLTCL
eukprot:scaffold149_cov315-Pinguiococcus_pyrenoidosus.AAC.109